MLLLAELYGLSRIRVCLSVYGIVDIICSCFVASIRSAFHSFRQSVTCKITLTMKCRSVQFCAWLPLFSPIFSFLLLTLLLPYHIHVASCG